MTMIAEITAGGGPGPGGPGVHHGPGVVGSGVVLTTPDAAGLPATAPAGE